LRSSKIDPVNDAIGIQIGAEIGLICRLTFYRIDRRQVCFVHHSIAIYIADQET
jgi:hypothetical protein